LLILRTRITRFAVLTSLTRRVLKATVYAANALSGLINIQITKNDKGDEMLTALCIWVLGCVASVLIAYAINLT
jgi:multisubunit Na+/H+ antiporter MnhG subunit